MHSSFQNDVYSSNSFNQSKTNIQFHKNDKSNEFRQNNHQSFTNRKLIIPNQGLSTNKFNKLGSDEKIEINRNKSDSDLPVYDSGDDDDDDDDDNGKFLDIKVI